MLSEFLSEITVFGNYQAISLIIFFLLFAGLTYAAIRLSKEHCERMSSLPLSADESEEKSDRE